MIDLLFDMAASCFYIPCASRNKSFRDEWNLRTGEEQFTLWRAPKGASKEDWLRNLPEGFRHFDFDNPNHVLCSLHFEDNYIIKSADYIVNDILYSFPRTHFRLSREAVPTIFEGTDFVSMVAQGYYQPEDKDKDKGTNNISNDNGVYDKAVKVNGASGDSGGNHIKEEESQSPDLDPDGGDVKVNSDSGDSGGNHIKEEESQSLDLDPDGGDHVQVSKEHELNGKDGMENFVVYEGDPGDASLNGIEIPEGNEFLLQELGLELEGLANGETVYITSEDGQTQGKF